MKKRWALSAAVLAVGAAVPLLALASHEVIDDANDTKGLFDVKRVKLSGEDKPTWRMITFSDWTVKRMFDRGYLLVQLDTFGDERYDYYALVRSDGYHMIGSLIRDRREKSDYEVSELDAWRPEKDTVKVRVPLAKMKIGNRRLTYTWHVQTLVTKTGCPSGVCIDDVPDDSGVEEPLPGLVEPTPTISPTVLPTPTPTPTLTPTPSPTSSP